MAQTNNIVEKKSKDNDGSNNNMETNDDDNVIGTRTEYTSKEVYREKGPHNDSSNVCSFTKEKTTIVTELKET